ncbi:MAG: hypothetical protein DRJ09_05420 [Bacteroidetes bacterium]|nr:MAG: hypothetical protein DRJ09_05420 [Bacteroidota bacterium]
MKKIILLSAMLFTAAIFISISATEDIVNNTIPGNEKYVVPEKVQAIIENKCFDCHNSNSKNMKGKMKLKFDKMAELKTHKLIGKLDNISEAVTEGDMPPKKAIKKYPDLKLTAEEIKTLSAWSNGLISKIAGE